MGGFGGSGGSGWAMGEWSVGQSIVGVVNYQKIYGLNSVKCLNVKKRSAFRKYMVCTV